MALARHVKYLAVARHGEDDGAAALLASHLHWDLDNPGGVNFDDRVQEVVQSPGWSGFIQSGRSRLDLTEPDALYYILVDSQRRVYVVVTSTGYPSRLAYRLQDELNRAVVEDSTAHHVSLSCPAMGLQRTMGASLKHLANKFDDLESIDKIEKSRAQMEDLTASMQNSLEAFDERSDLLESLGSKSEALSSAASQYQAMSSDLKASACKRYWKWTVLIVVIVLGGVVALLFFLGVL